MPNMPSAPPACEMEGFLGAPIRSHGRVFGNLYLTEKPGGLDEQDERLAAVLAAQAGAAIETRSSPSASARSPSPTSVTASHGSSTTA